MKYFSFLLFMLCNFWGKSQNYPISSINITLPGNPPVQISDWAIGVPPLTIVAQSKLVNGQVDPQIIESRVLVTIKSGTQKVCGSYTVQNAPMSGFNAVVKTWVGAQAISLLGGNCTLQPGEYLFCVQFFSSLQGNKALSNELCKSFTIRGKETQKFSPPTNITPADKKTFTEKEIKTPMTFRWTPVVPKPQQPVTYRLKVWQLMQGQNSTQAMRSNPPIVTKDVDNITQATIANLNGEPCMLPYLCSYVWNVEASKTNPQGEIEMLGSSEATGFGVTEKVKENPIKDLPKPIETTKNTNCITYKAPLIISPIQNDRIQLNKEELRIRFIPSNTFMADYKVIVWKSNKNKKEVIYEKIYSNNFNGLIKGLKLKGGFDEEYQVQLQAIQGKGNSLKTEKAIFQKNSCANFENNGFSNVVAFSIGSSCASDYVFSIDSAKCTQDKKIRIYCHVKFNNINSIASPNPTLSNATFIDNATNLPFTVSGFSTSITPLSLSTSGTDIPFSFDVEGETCDKTIRITYDINWDCPSGPQHIVACIDSLKMPCCYCSYCEKQENMIIQEITHSANIVAVENLNIMQQFNITPKNISAVKAEIVYMEEDQMEEACKQCRKDENEVYHFTGTNTTTWNSGTAINATAGNGAASFPTKILNWNSNNQGTIDFNLTIGLPGTAPLNCCSRHGKVCIRYSFTDIECKTCTQLVCYTY